MTDRCTRKWCPSQSTVISEYLPVARRCALFSDGKIWSLEVDFTGARVSESSVLSLLALGVESEGGDLLRGVPTAVS